MGEDSVESWKEVLENFNAWRNDCALYRETVCLILLNFYCQKCITSTWAGFYGFWKKYRRSPLLFMLLKQRPGASCKQWLYSLTLTTHGGSRKGENANSPAEILFISQCPILILPQIPFSVKKGVAKSHFPVFSRLISTNLCFHFTLIIQSPLHI